MPCTSRTLRTACSTPPCARCWLPMSRRRRADMSQDQLGLIPGRECAATRLADGYLRLFGNTQVTLRLASPSSGDTGSQLGLEAPPSQDLQISPAVVKALEPSADGRRRIEVTLSITALLPIA